MLKQPVGLPSSPLSLINYAIANLEADQNRKSCEWSFSNYCLLFYSMGTLKTCNSIANLHR